MPQQTKVEQEAEYKAPPLGWRFYVGQWVEIITQRPNVEQYHRAIGQIKVITNRDIIYVVIGRYTPCFQKHELRPMPVPGGSAA